MYGLPVHLEDAIFTFVIGRVGSNIDTVELLTLQAICTNAVKNILQLEPDALSNKTPGKLSAREKSVIISVAQGNSPADIAADLGLTEVTVNIMLNKIVEQLGSRNIPHAILIGIIEGEFGLSDCIGSPD